MTTEIKRINLGSVNCYLINTGDGFILVDTGGCTFNDRDLPAIRDRLENELQKSGCKPGNLKLAVITHGDSDHIENGAYLQGKYKTPIAVHKDDARMVENPDMNEYFKNVRFRSLFFTIVLKLIKVLMKLGLMKKMTDSEGFKPDLLIDEGFDLSPYGFDAKILHLPGHTNGSIAILTGANDLICGDILANYKKPDIAMNAFNFKELYKSVDRLKKLNIKTVYPGHGNPFQMDLFIKTNK